MTFKEKVMKMITTCDEQTLINNVCPYEIGLESEEVAGDCNGRCIDCWNREMPNTEPSEREFNVATQGYSKGYSVGRDDGYIQGLNDAWELAKKIADIPLTSERAKIFGFVVDGITVVDILRGFTPQEALAKLKAYEEAQKIEVGDVVELPIGTKCVVTAVRENMADGFTEVGYSFYDLPLDELKKTGKHIDISSILEQIGE